MTTIETSPPPPPSERIAVRPSRIAPGSVLPLILWAVLLIAGFAVVLGLGQPLSSDADQLERAFHPPPPVTEAVAIQSADTVVRNQYPQFANGVRSVTHQTDFGDNRWTIVYRIPRQLTGVRISVSERGSVTVGQYP